MKSPTRRRLSHTKIWISQTVFAPRIIDLTGLIAGTGHAIWPGTLKGGRAHDFGRIRGRDRVAI